jgi:hypothetical protein
MVVVAYHEYFLCALLLYRLMQKASANPSINGTVVEIWATLASSGQYLKSLLEHVVIWSESAPIASGAMRDGREDLFDAVVKEGCKLHPRREKSDRWKVLRKVRPMRGR